MTTMDQRAAAVGSETLTPVVRRALGSESAEVGEWRYAPLPYVNTLGDDRGLYRFSGTARDAGEAKPWSAVLKLVRPYPQSSSKPAHPAYWKREVLAFSSGLLNELPGLQAPRCYSLSEDADGTFSLWLEELSDIYHGRWPLERYGLAARHLGQFGGAFLTDRPLPGYDWLATRGGGPGAGGTAVEERLKDDKTWQHPAVRRAFPVPIAERVLRQREESRAFRSAIAQLPRTLCHNDSHDENLFARRREDGAEETVAVDWELMGIGPVSSDITFLVIATLRRLAVDMADAERLEEAVLEGYLAGLRDSGWAGDPVGVRLGYAAGVALRLGLVPTVLDLILDRSPRERAARVWNRPVEEIIERWAAVAYFVLDRVDRARELLDQR